MTERKKENFIQAVKFTLFSISAGLIQVASFTLLQIITGQQNAGQETTSPSYWYCYLPSLILSVIWNCTFNRKFTFKSAANVPRAMGLALLFYVPFIPLSTWWGDALAKAGWNEYLILALTMVINFVLEFLWQKQVVFKEKKA